MTPNKSYNQNSIRTTSIKQLKTISTKQSKIEPQGSIDKRMADLKKPIINKTIIVQTNHKPVTMKNLGVTEPKSSEKMIKPMGLKGISNRGNLGFIEPKGSKENGPAGPYSLRSKNKKTQSQIQKIMTNDKDLITNSRTIN